MQRGAPGTGPLVEDGVPDLPEPHALISRQLSRGDLALGVERLRRFGCCDCGDPGIGRERRHLQRPDALGLREERLPVALGHHAGAGDVVSAAGGSARDDGAQLAL